MKKSQANERKHALSENFRGLRLQMLSAALHHRAAFWDAYTTPLYVYLLA
jgi:hypothetical protein